MVIKLEKSVVVFVVGYEDDDDDDEDELMERGSLPRGLIILTYTHIDMNILKIVTKGLWLIHSSSSPSIQLREILRSFFLTKSKVPLRDYRDFD